MGAYVTAFGNQRSSVFSPQTVTEAVYRQPMGIREIVRDNVLRLLRFHEGLPDDAPIKAPKLIKLGVANGTAQRVFDAAASVGIDKLQDLARVLRVQPWQLLVENLDPRALPELNAPSPHEPWPFDFDFARFDALKATEQGMVERVAEEEVERLEARRANRVQPGVDSGNRKSA